MLGVFGEGIATVSTSTIHRGTLLEINSNLDRVIVEMGEPSITVEDAMESLEDAFVSLGMVAEMDGPPTTVEGAMESLAGAIGSLEENDLSDNALADASDESESLIGSIFGKTLSEYVQKVNAQRVCDLPSSELFRLGFAIDIQKTLSEAKSPRPFSDVPCFVPPGFGRRRLRPAGGFFKRSNGNTLAKLLDHFVLDSDCCARLVVAGGLPSKLLHSSPDDYPGWRGHYSRKGLAESGWPTDTDYFVVSETDATDELRNRVLGSFLQKCGGVSFNEDLELGVSVQHGVATVTDLNGDGGDTLERQLIMRGPYKTPGAVISGFDLGVSQVVCDGGDVMMTLAGLYAAVTGVELVYDLKRRSTSFECRVAKYFQRGTGFAFAGFDAEKLKAEMREHPDRPTKVQLNGLQFLVAPLSLQPKLEPNMWEARIVLPDQKGVSDYRSSWQPDDGYFQSEYTPLTLCRYLDQASKGGLAKIPTLVFVFDQGDDIPYIFPLSVGTLLESTAFQGFVERKTHSSEISRKTATFYAKMFRWERNYLGVSAEEAQKISAAAVRRFEENPATEYVKYGSILDAHFRRIQAYGQSIAEHQLDYWIKDNPGRQWTASLNPAIIKMQEWYRDWYIGDEAYSELLLSASVAGQWTRVDGPSFLCALCLDERGVGERNTIQLPCGHGFCWASNPRTECRGLTVWIRQSDTCPKCRADMYHTPRERLNPEQQTPLVPNPYDNSSELVPDDLDSD